MTENETTVIPSPDEVASQLTEETPQLTEGLNQESVEAVADTAQAETEAEPKESIGLANLRSHAEALESDINTLYKPVASFVEDYGGLDAVKSGLGLYDALQEYEPDQAASKFLDKTYELSPERYSAIVQRVFTDHGQEFLAKNGATQTKQESPEFDWKELAEEDPVKALIAQLQEQIENQGKELEAVKGQKQQDTAQAEVDARLNDFFANRYKPLEESLKSIDLGENSQKIKDAIRHTVEGYIESDTEAMRLFNEAAEMVREGAGALATRRIAEFDKKASQYIQDAVAMFTARSQNESTLIKDRLNNSNLPKAAATAAPAASAARSVPNVETSSAAFDEGSMLAKLRQLEASGRLPVR